LAGHIALYVAVIAVMLLVGYLEVQKDLARLRKRVDLTAEFRDNFMSFVNGGSSDMATYDRLIRRVDQTSAEIGSMGCLEWYRPPYSREQFRNYPALINTLTQLPRGMVDTQIVTFCVDALTRHLARLERLWERHSAELRNPVDWLRRSVELFTTLPIRLLVWSGLIQYAAFARWKDSLPSRLLTAAVFLVGLASSVVGLTTGWTPFLKLVCSWLR